METLNRTPERPPWPEDMEEALLAQQKKLQQMAASATRGRTGTAARTRIIRWAVRFAIVAMALWLLCETAIS